MRYLVAAQIREGTPWSELFDAIADVVAEESVESPDRHVHPIGLPDGGIGSLLLMPAWIDREIIGVKTVTYFPSNAAIGSPTINAAYLLFDGQRGDLLAVLDGDELTARRTAAISALAAKSLARADASHLLIIGTGQLAPNMAHAHSTVRSLQQIEIWGRNPDAATAVAEQLADQGLPAVATPSLDEAIGRADIISCVTGATSPIVRGELLAPGTHLDLVGSFRSDMRESDDTVVTRAAVFVDTVAGAIEAGDLAQPLADGLITEESILADLRSLVTGVHPGRRTSDDITVFKLAGFASADLAAARLALRMKTS